MIAENRETAEGNQSREACMDALRKYLSNEADYTSMQNPSINEAMRKRLYYVAKDYCLKYGMSFSDSEYAGMVDDVIGKFMSTWKDKKVGEDRRGNSLAGRGLQL